MTDGPATVDALPGIEEIENLWIPMPDGINLAARIWLPEGAWENPIPAILEYIPYRKRDFFRTRDEPIHRFFAAHGYASVRVDVRGSGDSDGILADEYSAEELRDAATIIDWISTQPWCAGTVGMMGISWGGFNALQVAAEQPPALKAIITMCAADDRYADDAHYMGGCLLNENMQWGSMLTMTCAMPPDPLIVGERWKEMWRARIEALEPFPVVWMRHPWRDAFWQRGSVCEDYDRIQVPVYAIGGWADGYSNAIPRLMQHLSVPRKGLIGPWAHVFPHDALPGPSIGFLQEALKWWDHWLKDEATGIMEEPMLRAWIQESVPPLPQYDMRPGRWVAEDDWPSPRIRPWRLHLNLGHLAATAEEATEISFCSPQTTGVRSGEWCGFGVAGEMPRDQRPDDGGSIVFEGDPLPERVEILGAAEVEFEVRSDKPVALVAARLNEVAEDGSVLRVTYGLLNLAHRDGHAAPKPLEPGKWYRVRMKLNDVGHAFPPGHRIRLALSSSYWPIAWPAPEPAILTLRIGTGTLTLPVRPPVDDEAALPPFEAPLQAEGSETQKLRPIATKRRIEIDLATNEQVFTLSGDAGELEGASLAHLPDIGLDLGYTMHRVYRIHETDPQSAQAEFVQTALLRREGWDVRLTCRTHLTATASMFQFSGHLRAWLDDAPFLERHWTLSVPRQLL
jgi:uncharacterized protein